MRYWNLSIILRMIQTKANNWDSERYSGPIEESRLNFFLPLDFRLNLLYIHCREQGLFDELSL